MDPITHALSGALVALALDPAGASRSPVSRRLRVTTGALAGVFPDAVLWWRWTDPLAVLSTLPNWTHAPLLAPLWALLLAVLLASGRRCLRDWPALAVIAGAAIGAHLVLDLLTANGLSVGWPFTAARHALPLLHPLDPWLLLVAVVAAGVAVLRPSWARRAAVGCFAACACYLLALGHWREQALAIGERQASTRGVSGGAVHAFPQPLSPLHWQVLVAHEDAFEIAWVRLPLRPGGPAPTAQAAPSATTAPRHALAAVLGAYRPPAAVRWEFRSRFGEDSGRAELVRSAWNQPEFEPFRRFSVHTVFSHAEYSSETRQVCAWFYDARFALPELPPALRFGACQHMDERTWSIRRAPGPLPFL